ncbi:MAG: thiamine pyrophosphate-dependent dehydrogenase E1 component subunit alpha [Bdellovibrionaceae bacterium]|nr:thiamine pyrophosphate-dependent dehydrogenase E1 component subunit alpha [Pseudobdellovibrionaceae bacterium]
MSAKSDGKKKGLVKIANKKQVQTKSKDTAKSDSLAQIPDKTLIQILDLMIKSRVLEERLIKIYRAGESYFWIGGPGEEAWGVPIGMLARKGEGPKYDFLHLHYRCTPTLIAMGMDMKDSIRLMMNRVTDPSTGGRNFSNHYCFPKMNIAPVTSPIEVQYGIALGTAHAQKRLGDNAISIVTGGDAGTAEGDFASCLIWASRKGNELPMLITVQNNYWGISTSYEGQHGESAIADRARGFNIRARVVNGNDPVESYIALKEEMDYIRRTGKPSFIESKVSRLYGHSSASGANFVGNEEDCIKSFSEKLISRKLVTEKDIKRMWETYEAEALKATEDARAEGVPAAESIWDHVYANNENSDWRKF